jgi:dephospho-CoA kinase
VLVVGVTGGIGSGKSTVAGLLAERGGVLIDADAVAREVVEPGGAAYDALRARFPDVFDGGGRLDRGAMAGVAFEDPEALAALNDITHPAIGNEILRRIAAAPPDAILVLDVPLIVEAGARSYDVVVVVVAPRATRLDRLEARGVDRDDAERRMAVQASDDERRAMADYVVENAGSLDALVPEVERVWTELVRRADEKVTSAPTERETERDPGPVL